jgi:prevent-host-death family protein
MSTKTEPKGEPVWQLREAKARVSEVVRRAVDEGPQHVSVRGVPAAVVLSEEAHRRLTWARPSILDRILEGEPWPDALVDAINDRPSGPVRDVDL